MMEYVTLNNGVKMPKLGYGVYQVSSEECERCVLDAISVGYRAIDTAQSYGNEEAVGSAIQKCGVPRDELFLTTKVWITNAGYDQAKASIQQSMDKLGTDYLDLLLIHQPFGDYYGTYRTMEELYDQGKLRAIGRKYGKTAAQTALRFLMQSDVVVIPKSVHKDRMQQNFDLFDFTLSAEDMAAIQALDGGESLFFSHYDPKTVEWFMSIL